MTAQTTTKIHPGRILLEEYLAPRGLSVWRLAKDIGVPVRRLFEIVQSQRQITTDIAHRLALPRHVGALLARSLGAVRRKRHNQLVKEALASNRSGTPDSSRSNIWKQKSEICAALWP